MNIVFWFLVVVSLVFIWFLLSFLFKGIGHWVLGLFYDVKCQITKDENKEE